MELACLSAAHRGSRRPGSYATVSFVGWAGLSRLAARRHAAAWPSRRTRNTVTTNWCSCCRLVLMVCLCNCRRPRRWCPRIIQFSFKSITCVLWVVDMGRTTARWWGARLSPLQRRQPHPLGGSPGLPLLLGHTWAMTGETMQVSVKTTFVKSKDSSYLV